jgi:hypothetical protein
VLSAETDFEVCIDSTFVSDRFNTANPLSNVFKTLHPFEAALRKHRKVDYRHSGHHKKSPGVKTRTAKRGGHSSSSLLFLDRGSPESLAEGDSSPPSPGAADPVIAPLR